jgi:hypothetical protein
MSNPYMKSSYFHTQVNQANLIKNCFPCPPVCQTVCPSIPSNLVVSTLTVNGKATINGLIDPTGMEFTPVNTNPGGIQENTIWVNSIDSNLYFGSSTISVNSVNSITAGTNISTSGTVSNPIINFAPGGIMNMNGAELTNTSTLSVSSIIGNNLHVNMTTGNVVISSISNDNKLQIVNGTGIRGTFSASANEGAVVIDSTTDMIVMSAASSYLKTTNSTGNILLQVDGDCEATLGSGLFQVSSETGNGVIRVQGQGGKGGEITADENTGNFVIEGKDGLATIIQGTSLIGLGTSDVASAIGMTAGPAGASLDIVANGDDTGKISLIAQTSGNATEITINGSTTEGIITAKADEINLITTDGTASLIITNGDITLGTNDNSITISDAGGLVQINSKLIPEQGIVDVGGSLGTENQFLSSTGSQVYWQTIPLVWGSFFNTNSITINNANTTTFITYDSSSSSVNCAISGNGFTVSKACSKLRIQSSLIASPTQPDTTFRFWLRKNSTDVANTCSVVTLKSTSDKVLCVCEWFVSCSANDVFYVLCQANQVTSTVYGEVAGGTAPNTYPATPSIITTVQGFA